MNGFIQFDVSSLSGMTIDSAILQIDVAQIVRGDGGTIELRMVETAWSEHTLTSANQPAFGAPLATLPISLGDAGGTVSVGITRIVQGWADGTILNHGLALTSSDTERLNVSLGSDTARIDVRLADEQSIAPAQVELKWIPPVTRSDGSALHLSEIGGYILQMNDTVLSNDISADAVALTVDNLWPGEYCFRIATRDSEDQVGPFSDAACWSVLHAPADPLRIDTKNSQADNNCC